MKNLCKILNKNLNSLLEDTVYDHSWYEVKKQKYPKRTKDGVKLNETFSNESEYKVGQKLMYKKNGTTYVIDKVKGKYYDIKDSYSNKVYPVYKNTLDSEFKLLKESLEDEELENDTTEVEEPKEKSSSDPEIAKFIETSESVIDNTLNPEIIKGILDSINSKMPLVSDIEQMNKLGELKQKTETKLASVKNIKDISESIDDNTIINVGDNVVFTFNGKTITGKVTDINTQRGENLYSVISWNYDKNKNDMYKNVTITRHEIQKVQENQLQETASVGATSCANISGYAKALGKPKKRKNKTPSLDVKLFKECIINDLPSMITIGKHTLNYFLYENKFYLGVDNHLVKTFDKEVMLESIDKIYEGNYNDVDLLKNYSCYEMNMLMETENNIELSKIGRLAGTYDVLNHKVNFLNVGEFHSISVDDYENGVVRFGIQKINNKVKCYITAIDKGYAYKTYKFIKNNINKFYIDEYELEILTDDGSSVYIKLDDNGNQLFENKSIQHCDSSTIRKISKFDNLDSSLYNNIVSDILKNINEE